MSSISSVSSTAHNGHHLLSFSNSTITITPPKMPANGSSTETASIGGGGFAALLDHPGGDKSFAAQSCLPPRAKDYSDISSCPFTAGQYTEF
jgi:hypothetical protein